MFWRVKAQKNGTSIRKKILISCILKCNQCVLFSVWHYARTSQKSWRVVAWNKSAGGTTWPRHFLVNTESEKELRQEKSIFCCLWPLVLSIIHCRADCGLPAIACQVRSCLEISPTLCRACVYVYNEHKLITYSFKINFNGTSNLRFFYQKFTKITFPFFVTV
jgi:hypothetical protein